MSTNAIPASTGHLTQDPQAQRPPAVASATAIPSALINILIVDDEPKNLTVLETVLDDSDYRLVRAESADQALRALVVEQFALLILDVRLPDMNGFELAQMIKRRKKTAGVPIIFLTAYYHEDQHVLEGYGTGAVDYLVKPVNPAILRSKVAVFAELHRKSCALLAEVTERRRVEGQLRELNDTLDQRVTERTQALERASAALQETGEQYRSLFDGSLDAIFFLGTDERFKAANSAALRLIAHTIEELKTIRFLDLCAPDQRESVGNAFRAVFRHQGFAIDTAVVTATGERRDLFISGAPEIRDGEVVGISCIARDITERIKTEEALRERDRTLTAVNDALKKQAVALAIANRELEGFSYSVSHDLRAPLRTIDAFSRIIEEDHGSHLNPEVHRCLTIVRKAAGQAGELIDDLLEFSRLGRQEMRLRSVKMTDLAREAADDLIIMQADRQVDLTIGDLPSCQGDRRLLKLVWNNLISNALKYTKNRNACRIEVGWMPDDASPEAVIYYVKDNGVGFDMRYVHKLFGVFQRLHRKEDFEGTGVGLAIVQRIVQRHGGRVWAEGKVDGGATFFFSLQKTRP